MISISHKILFGRSNKNTEMGGACGTYGRQEKCYRVSVRKSEGKRPLGRPRHRWEDNIKMDLQEVGCEDMD